MLCCVVAQYDSDALQMEAESAALAEKVTQALTATSQFIEAGMDEENVKPWQSGNQPLQAKHELLKVRADMQHGQMLSGVVVVMCCTCMCVAQLRCCHTRCNTHSYIHALVQHALQDQEGELVSSIEACKNSQRYGKSWAAKARDQNRCVVCDRYFETQAQRDSFIERYDGAQARQCATSISSFTTLGAAKCYSEA
jgi:hypothetical protein